MRLRILHVPDCPNASVLTARIDGLLVGRDDVVVEHRVVRNEADALACGMTGSPTLLVDGVDPFTTTPVLPPSMSCRLYADETGALSGTPSVAQLRAVLLGAHHDAKTGADPSARGRPKAARPVDTRVAGSDR